MRKGKKPSVKVIKIEKTVLEVGIYDSLECNANQYKIETFENNNKNLS